MTGWKGAVDELATRLTAFDFGFLDEARTCQLRNIGGSRGKFEIIIRGLGEQPTALRYLRRLVGRNSE